MYTYYNDVYDNPSIPLNGGTYYSNVNVDPSSFIQDPLYMDYLTDHHLASGSPCIDAGDPDPQYDDYDGTRNDLRCYSGPLDD